MNSLIVVAINLVGMLVIYSLMANALTRFYWRGQGAMGVLGTIIVAGLFWIFPPFVPGLRDVEPTLFVLWLGNWLVSGFSVVILCQSARWIPRELEDSARLDGCGWLGTYRRIVLPLFRRELGLIAFLTLMATSVLCWTTFTTPGKRILPPWLHLLLPLDREHGPGLTKTLLMVMAGSVAMALPVMAIFFLSKNWFPRRSRRGNG